MQGHQGRRAGRVDRDRRALETERVGDPARGDAAQPTCDQIAFQVIGHVVKTRRIVAAGDSCEDARPAAPQRGRVDPGPFEQFPCRFQQQSLLRIGRQRLPRRYSEEGRVELRRTGEEAAVACVGLTRPIGVRIEQLLNIPSAVGRELRNSVAAALHQSPQILRRFHPSRIVAAHPHDRDRLPPARLDLAKALLGLPGISERTLQIFAEFLFIRHCGKAPS